MRSCCSTRRRWKRWTSLLMRSTWCRSEVRTTAGRTGRRGGSWTSFPLRLRLLRFCPQSGRLGRGKPAGRVWERGLGPQHQSLPHCALLQHQQSPVRDGWEVRRGCVWDFLQNKALTSLFCCSSALRVWELDPLNRKIKPTECQTGVLKRAVECVEVRRCFPQVCSRWVVH